MGDEVSLHYSHFLLVIQLSVTQVYHGQRQTCKNLERIESRRRNAVVIFTILLHFQQIGSRGQRERINN